MTGLLRRTAQRLGGMPATVLGTLRHSRTHRQALAERWAIEAVMSGPVLAPHVRSGLSHSNAARAHLVHWFRERGATVRNAVVSYDVLRDQHCGWASVCFMAGKPLRMPERWRVESTRRVLARAEVERQVARHMGPPTSSLIRRFGDWT